MVIFTRDDLTKLMANPNETSVTIYMPANRVSEKEQDHLRLKNLVKESSRQLLSAGIRRPSAEAILGPVEKLLDDALFWRRRGRGLAIYASPDFFKFYWTPYELQEAVTIGNGFNLAPITPLLYNNGRYFILVLSENRVRLLECTRDSCRNATPEDMPKSEIVSTNLDTPETARQYHNSGTGESVKAAAEVGSTASIGAGAQVWHGPTVLKDMEKKYISEYFQSINRSLKNLLKDPKDLLLLAGVGYLHPIYHKVNTFEGLLQDGLIGNFDETSEQVIHDKAWPIVQPLFSRKMRRVIDNYHLASSKGRASAEPGAVIAATKAGRVETLFLAKGRELWGKVDASTGQVELSDLKEGIDLANLAAVTALNKGADVYTLEPEQMPDEALMAAEFRF